MRHCYDGDAALAKGIYDGADAGTALGVEHGAGLVEQQDLSFGSMASAPAMATRWVWPPDRLGGVARVVFGDMQTALSEASTRLAISGWGTQRFSGPNATSSATMP